MVKTAEIVGTAEHSAQFVELCRARIDALGITMATVDEVCGFPDRYTAGVMSGKRFSAFSLFLIAQCLAMVPTFLHDEKQLAELTSRSDWVKLHRPGPRWRSAHQSAHRYLTPDFLHLRASAGGRAYRHKVPKQRRIVLARKAALARWNGAKSHEQKGKSKGKAKSKKGKSKVLKA